MKKSIVVTSVICALLFAMLAFKEQTYQGRTYTIILPEKLGNSFYQMITGNADAVPLGEYKEISASVIPQLMQQNKKFVEDDSVAAAKLKKPIPPGKDSSGAKPKN